MLLLGNTEGIRDEILSIALDPYKYIQGENITMLTFVTFLAPSEMKEYFGSTDDRSYFLFEMNSDSAMVSLNDKSLESYLFDGLINPKGNIDVIDTIFGSMGVNNYNNDIEKIELYHNPSSNDPLIEMLNTLDKHGVKREDKFSEDKLNSYTKEERDELVDELLEKGTNLTESDKEVLNFLIKKKD